jgi:transcriptional regulator with XRE-family HTH domain
MKITKEATDDAILGELGGRMAQVRLGKNLTQAQLAAEAGVSKRTVERLELGEVAAQMSGFIRICRALDMIERFELLVPEPVASPMAQLKLGGRKRRRASASDKPSAKATLGYPEKVDEKMSGLVAEEAPAKWTWGVDEP